MSPFLARLGLATVGLLLLLWLVVLWWPAAPSSGPPIPPPSASLPQPSLPPVPLPAGTDPDSLALRRAILNGERIYQRLCHHCHGRYGKGDHNDYMASIGHKPADHTDLIQMQTLSDEAFFLALRDGVKDKRGWLTMPPWASILSTADMWDVIAYVRRLPLATVPDHRSTTTAKPLK